MAITHEVMPRVFKYSGATLPDPDPSLTPMQVRDVLSALYPELSSAEVGEPVVNGGTLEYTLSRAVGTKG